MSYRPARAWEPMMEQLEARQLMAAVFWDGGGGNFSWHNPLNWSSDVLPGPDDDVVINAPGNPVIRYDDPNAGTIVRSLLSLEAMEIAAGSLQTAVEWRQAGAMVVSGGSAGSQGHLILNANVLWTGGLLSGENILVLPLRQLRIAGDVTLAGTLVNNGSVVWESGDLLGMGAAILNLPGRTLEMRSNGHMNAVNSGVVLSNHGVVTRTGDPLGTSTVSFTLNNRGFVNAHSGVLDFNGAIVQREAGGVLRGGGWTVSSGNGTLVLGSGQITTFIAAESGPSEVWLRGLGAMFPQFEGVQIIQGLVDRPAWLKLTGGRPFTFSGLQAVDSLLISNPGMTTVVSANMAIRALGVGAGVMSWTGGGRVLSTHVVIGAELALPAPTNVSTVSGLGLVRILGETTWQEGLWVGGPTLIGASGTLVLAMPSNLPPFGMKLMGRRVINYGTIDWNDIFGEWRLGAELVNRGTFIIGAPGFISTFFGSAPVGAPVWIINHGVINKQGDFDSTLRGAGGGVRLANFGAVNVNQGRLIASGGGLSTGVFNIGAGAELAFGGLAGVLSGAMIAGEGNLRIANLSLWNAVTVAGAGGMVVTPAGVLGLGGATTITRGLVTNHGAIVNGQGAQTIVIADAVNHGTLVLAKDSTTLQFSGNLELTPSSVVRVGIAGDQAFGRMSVIGSFTAAGTLWGHFEYHPAPGTLFNFLILGAHTGTFDGVAWTGLPPGFSALFEYEDGLVNFGRLRVVSFVLFP